MERENRINEILNSTNGMMKVIPDEMLFSKIQAKITVKKPVKSSLVWIAAASITVLIGLNIKVISLALNKNKQEVIIASEIVKSNQLY